MNDDRATIDDPERRGWERWCASTARESTAFIRATRTNEEGDRLTNQTNQARFRQPPWPPHALTALILLLGAPRLS